MISFVYVHCMHDQAKAAYDRVQAEVKKLQEKVDVLLPAREKSYQ